jgi:hypothetical protein
MKTWKCTKCGREFARRNQSHSCAVFPLENHFKNKEKAEILFKELVSKMKNVGEFRVDSPKCCIHFVKATTFSGTYVLKEKLRVFFTSRKEIKSPRISKSFKISNSKYESLVDIRDKKEIDEELINWIKQAYDMDNQ